MTNKALYMLLVPVMEDGGEGEPFGKADYDRLHVEFLRRAGGYTFMGEAAGAWVPERAKGNAEPSEGDLLAAAICEPMRVYYVALDCPKAARHLAEWVASYFAQECAFLAQVSPRVEFVED